MNYHVYLNKMATVKVANVQASSPADAVRQAQQAVSLQASVPPSPENAMKVVFADWGEEEGANHYMIEPVMPSGRVDFTRFQVLGPLMERLPGHKPPMVATQEEACTAIEHLRALLKVLHPGAVGLIYGHHGDEAGERAFEAITAAKHFLANAPQDTVYQGTVSMDGVCVDVEFHAPTGATLMQKDAACLASLAQKAHIDYWSLGNMPEALTPA